MKSRDEAGRENLSERPRLQKKKTYEPPRLREHGDLRRLTRAKGGSRVDPGIGPPDTKR